MGKGGKFAGLSFPFETHLYYLFVSFLSTVLNLLNYLIRLPVDPEFSLQNYS